MHFLYFIKQQTDIYEFKTYVPNLQICPDIILQTMCLIKYNFYHVYLLFLNILK